jgi:hypothetical protein
MKDLLKYFTPFGWKVLGGVTALAATAYLLV